jgi:hypothetical protein
MRLWKVEDIKREPKPTAAAHAPLESLWVLGCHKQERWEKERNRDLL